MQIDLFNIIEEVTGVNHCIICKQPTDKTICSEDCTIKFITIKIKQDEKNNYNCITIDNFNRMREANTTNTSNDNHHNGRD